MLPAIATSTCTNWLATDHAALTRIDWLTYCYAALYFFSTLIGPCCSHFDLLYDWLLTTQLSLSLLALLLLDLLLGIEQLVHLHMDLDLLILPLLLVLDCHNQQSKQLLTLFYLLVAISYARALPLLLIDWINRICRGLIKGINCFLIDWLNWITCIC